MHAAAHACSTAGRTAFAPCTGCWASGQRPSARQHTQSAATHTSHPPLPSIALKQGSKALQPIPNAQIGWQPRRGLDPHTAARGAAPRPPVSLPPRLHACMHDPQRTAVCLLRARSALMSSSSGHSTRSVNPLVAWPLTGRPTGAMAAAAAAADDAASAAATTASALDSVSGQLTKALLLALQMLAMPVPVADAAEGSTLSQLPVTAIP